MRDGLSAMKLLGRLLVVVGLAGAACGAMAAGSPDVTVFDLSDTTNYGTAGGIRGYSVGTTSCNVGTLPLNWCNVAGGCGSGTTNRDHPVIAQGMYRLKNGRMDQIGASWLKHGFVSLNNTSAGCGNGTCVSPPLGGRQLGVGCTDPYVSSLNGSRPLGRKSEVNPATGAYPFPIGGGGATSAVWNQRVAVAESDMIAAQNPGARYFVEGQYIAPDDALSGNGLNNASYREVAISAGTFNLTMVGATVRQLPAIDAWAVIDNTVQIFRVDIPGPPVERFNVAVKVTEVTPGTLWHYEYAVHNLNSARAADALRITFAGNTTFSGAGFHDVNAHSNEPYDTADWPSTTGANSIEWAAPAFPSSPNDANAIRWSTTYNFWFDANQPPSQIDSMVLDLFTAGTPTQVEFGQAVFSNGFE